MRYLYRRVTYGEISPAYMGFVKRDFLTDTILVCIIPFNLLAQIILSIHCTLKIGMMDMIKFIQRQIELRNK